MVEAARAYLAGRPVENAVFAVATPIESDRIKLTNSPWAFSIEATRKALGLERLVVINDFVAQALAVPVLAETERRKLGGGEAEPNRPIAVIGAGTGLGVAGLIPTLGAWQPVASEGGHASFAPHDELDLEILKRLWARFGHVSKERVLAGPGLVNLAVALAEIAGETLPPLQPRDVSERARRKECRHCVEALRRYTWLLGAAAGDLALIFLARGGVFIAGGVCANLGDLFDPAQFRAGFVAKGRFEAYLDAIPTWLVTRSDTGLIGTAAMRLDL